MAAETIRGVVMAHLIHGEIKLDFHKNGNWQDLVSILLMNGYVLDVRVKEGKIIVTIMTEGK